MATSPTHSTRPSRRSGTKLGRISFRTRKSRSMRDLKTLADDVESVPFDETSIGLPGSILSFRPPPSSISLNVRSFDEDSNDRPSPFTGTDSVLFCQSTSCTACRSPQIPKFVPSIRPKQAAPLVGIKWYEDDFDLNQLLQEIFRWSHDTEEAWMTMLDDTANGAFRCWS